MNKDLQDHVWSILPKEFKDEVKYEYNRVATKARKDEYDLGFMHAHEGIFGIHILTSDADEEEEMLYVSRKQVQKMYSYNEEELTKDPTNKGALLLKLRLDALFGSKCRPDEGTDCTPVEVGVAENATTRNVESLEPKPAEPKFKIGDELVWDKRILVKIDEVLADGKYLVFSRIGNRYMVKESDLEPYTEPTANYLRSEGALNTAVLAGNYSSASTCDKQFDSIINDGFKNHNRLHIATQMAAAILSSDDMLTRDGKVETKTPANVARSAFDYADALIHECEKGGGNA